jgi:hypothetical protein
LSFTKRGDLSTIAASDLGPPLRRPIDAITKTDICIANENLDPGAV